MIMGHYLVLLFSAMLVLKVHTAMKIWATRTSPYVSVVTVDLVMLTACHVAKRKFRAVVILIFFYIFFILNFSLSFSL